MKKIKILGAGPSGLASAITFAKAGYDVEAFERSGDVGVRFRGDIQGLENWTEKMDVLEDLRQRGIEINFDCDPVFQFLFTNGPKSKEMVFHKPVFYLVKRGSFEGSLDYGLKMQAVNLGVKIFFNSTIPKEEANIIATGPINNKNTAAAKAAAKGLVFKTTAPDTAICLLDDKAAYKGYSYLLITKGYGCMCSTAVNKLDRLNSGFERTKKIFAEMVDFNMEDPKEAGGGVCFLLNNTFKVNNSLLVGESAGIQDYFAGFGIRSSIISGNMAAESIINNMDYEKLAGGYFQDKQKAGLVMRFLWERASFNKYSLIMNNLKNKGDAFDILYSFTNFNRAEKILFPFVRSYMKLRSRI